MVPLVLKVAYFGVLCGIIGTIQATETIKIILAGTTLEWRLLVVQRPG